MCTVQYGNLVCATVKRNNADVAEAELQIITQ
jgi:hypothetical protein